jgi:hypothetical protein
MANKKQAGIKIINLGQMDAVTCMALNGIQNEDRQCLVRSEQNERDSDDFIIKRMNYNKPSRTGQTINLFEIIENNEKPERDEPEDFIERVEFDPYSVDWAIRKIKICISNGYDEELCAGSILGEMRKQGKYDEIDALFDETFPKTLIPNRILIIIKQAKEKYDTIYNKRIKHFAERGINTPMRRKQAVEFIYPCYDYHMNRPFPPKKEHIVKEPLSEKEIPDWLYEQPTGLQRGGRPRLADSIPMRTEEQQEEIAKRFHEMTKDEIQASREFSPRDHYYLKRYGMTEKEYKKRKEKEWKESD